MRTPILSLLLAGALAACGSSKAAETGALAPEVSAKVPLGAAESLPTPDLLIITGAVKADQSSMVASDTAGRAIAVMVDVNSKVKVGDPLLRLDTSNATLSGAEVRAQLAGAQAQQQLADAECVRSKALLDKGAITKSQYDREMTNCTAAAQNVAAIVARSRQVGKAISDGIVRAPFSGIISEKWVSVGEWVAPGSRLVQLVDDDPLKVDISVPESAIAKVKEGQEVGLTTVAYGDKVFKATITRIGSVLTETPRALECEATIEPGSGLKPGMFVSVWVKLGLKPMPAVPVSALAQRGSTWRLWAVVKGHLEERVVERGPDLPGGKVAIATGVAVGEKVAINVLDKDGHLVEQVSDGVKVE
ncbi:MAG: efflux RND transporter periplasmic adaptor subunit [Deltaproteobacteria bacterium]|nr:efflux RND transporter periplasmic adaptor subunit [Deltaproteobacteria bacterium]